MNVSAGIRNAEPHRKSENAALNSRGNAPRRPETSEEFCKSLPGTGDSLLIIALIILLWREKADMKLIAALAFILLT